MTGDMARVTLRQLMTMSAGFQYDDSTPSPFADAIRHDGDAILHPETRAGEPSG
jgi:CubicO group peptidase (beta-lactamase class C family)